jgi:CheY-like chemotaxis protein
MKKILVIEDNETNMYLISFILKENGYKVIEAGTGEVGVGRWKGSHCCHYFLCYGW